MGVVLSSRSGRMGGRALEVATSALKRVAACDIGDGADGLALLALARPTGVLHAAGAGDKGLLIELVAQRLHWMHASKAMGAWHLQCAAASAHLERLVLFSSVGSALGNVGQGNYAAGNACLDEHARSQRARGTVACSVQWPLVGGAGMGAAAFAAMGERQVMIAGFAGISLEEYAAVSYTHLTLPTILRV